MTYEPNPYDVVRVPEAHLGGYMPGGDPNTFYPALWEWLIENGVGSMVDVGAGEGHTLDFFASLGCVVYGVEGVPQEHQAIVQHDYTTGPFPPPGEKRLDGAYDLAWSCEFVEHVAEEFIPNYLATFRLAPLVLMTHALPGQGGYHHVNCQPDSYWITELAAIDYRFDRRLTEKCRALARMEDIPEEVNYFFRSGLAFRAAS